MDKRKKILISVAVFLLAVIMVELGAHFILTKRKEGKLKINPASLYQGNRLVFYDWDVTKKQAHFEVLRAAPEDKSLELRFIFPLKYENNAVKARIGCGPEDSRVSYTKSASRPEVAPEPLYRIVKKGDVFRGICADAGCTKINRECEAYVSQE